MPTHRRICDQQHRANNNRSHPFSYRGGSPPNHALLFGARPCNRTIDKHVAELCKYSRTIYRLMAINLAKAEERMQYFSNRARISKSFTKGEIVKLQGGRATRSDQHKLQTRFRVTDIVRSLGNINYEIRLPEGSSIHPVVHADKLEKFWTANLTKFPLAQQPGPAVLLLDTPSQPTNQAQKYPVRKYLLRNWNSVPPRYYVQWDTPAKELGWAYEDDALISDVAVYDK